MLHQHLQSNAFSRRSRAEIGRNGYRPQTLSVSSTRARIVLKQADTLQAMATSSKIIVLNHLVGVLHDIADVPGSPAADVFALEILTVQAIFPRSDINRRSKNGRVDLPAPLRRLM